MIYEVIKILTEQVSAYTGSTITLGNVALIESQGNGSTNLENTTLATLINLSEEGTMKNFPNTRVVGDRIETSSPIVNLNLFVLFSSSKNTYTEALKDISKIIEFFQGKQVFTQANTVFNRSLVEFAAIDNFRFCVDLYTPTFEELNYIWGSLGGKQIPSVLYKLSLIQIQRKMVTSQAGSISESGISSNQL